MMISKPNLVRMITAVIVLTGSVWFVANYTRFSHFRFNFEHKDGHLIAITELLVLYCQWLYLLPLVILSIGLWLIYFRSQAATALEILISGTWLFALGLAGFCVLIWQVQNVPMFSHMEWHY